MSKKVKPLLVPKKQILRIDKSSNKPYAIVFEKETINQMYQDFLEEDPQISITSVFDFWITKKQINDIPAGSLVYQLKKDKDLSVIFNGNK